MSSDLAKNAIAFLQKRYPQATVLNNETTINGVITAHDGAGNTLTSDIIFKIWPVISQDPTSGMKQRLIAVNDLGHSDDELAGMASHGTKIIDELDKGLFVSFDNTVKRKGHPIDTNQMPFAPKIYLYTNKVHCPYDRIISAFAAYGVMVEIASEAEMYKTLFISYGGTDEAAAAIINSYLKSKGIQTWFFPDDALPGQKLHQMMHDEVNRHDRILLICSRQSLSRPGVLNEIEKSLEREAKEGGSAILIPVTLDDFVYGDWAPSRKNLAEQVRSRVITKIDIASEKEREKQLDKLVKALAR
jgi:hypothetical protein